MKKVLFKPENIFIIVCLFWGSIFALLNPPFQAPDEDAHLFKMYGYTIGSINYKKQNGWSGQILPTSIINLHTYYNKYKLNTELKNSLKETFLASKIKLEKDKTEFFTTIYTSYTPISYFPSFIVLWLLKLLNFTPLSMIYILRFCSLLTYLSLTYFAIKITPVKKWLFLLLAILPLNLYQSGAVSTDGLSVGLIFLFFAYTLKLKFDENRFTLKKLVKWGSLIALISICKFAYFPFILLFFLIPKEKFESPTLRAKYFLSVFLINSAITALFLAYTIVISKGAITELTAITTDKMPLLIDIFKHPIIYLKAVTTTTVGLSRFYINNMISSFGWNSVMIPIFASNLYYVLLAMAAIYTDKTEENMTFKLTDRIVLISTVLLAYLAVMTSVYLLYQRFPFIIGIQGRYLTPILTLVFLLFMNKFIKTGNKIIPTATVIISQFILFAGLLTLITRFY